MAPDVGGVHELAESGASGILCETGSAEAIAAAGETLLSELPARSGKAREAIPKLQSRYGVDAMARAFYRILAENNL
jgi:glycosyltransferase involved in cell wall biosynthesis